MATLSDVREIALALPGVTEVVDGRRGGASWRVKDGMFAWERAAGKADRAPLAALGRVWPDAPVIGLRTDGLQVKEELLAALPDILFTIPHFDGYPAVLARLDAVERPHLDELIIDAWIVKAPKKVAREWLDEHGLAE